MESLVSILESYDINESFKSQTLRELMTVINKTAFKEEHKLILPRGIAWDKIEEKDVFYGETSDESFFKNFVSKKDYICIWFPLVGKDILKNNSRKTYYLEPGRFVLSCGTSFIQSPGNESSWKITPSIITSEYLAKQEKVRKEYGEKREGEEDWQYRKRTYSVFPGDRTVTRAHNVSGKDYGELNRNVTVKNLFDYSLCSIIAISKEVIAANDTSELINNRYMSKVGATALMLEPISDQEKRDNLSDKSYYGKTYELKASDYPIIRKLNRERYEKVLRVDRYKHKGLALLKKYEPIMREAIEAIEKYSKEVRTVPTFIKMISDEDFIDVYFNHTKSGSEEIAEQIENLQVNYDLIVTKIDKAINRYKQGYNNGSWWIDDVLKDIDKSVKNIRIILNNLEYLSK